MVTGSESRRRGSLLSLPACGSGPGWCRARVRTDAKRNREGHEADGLHFRPRAFARQPALSKLRSIVDQTASYTTLAKYLADRKSVVEVKSVSVRVALGGRRISK